MPLRSAGSDAFADDLYLGVSFAMLDRDSRVLCRVSKAALEDRAAKDGLPGTAVDTFRRCREEIEAIASRQYDEGLCAPVVRSEDLASIRTLPGKAPLAIAISAGRTPVDY
jgi:hypothetical protein